MEIKVMHQIMEWNEDVSDAVKSELDKNKVLLINVLGSPGAGKTSLLVRLIEKLRDEFRIGVIEGDIQGIIDAEKMADLKIPVVQLDTDGACHIEAESIRRMLPMFSLPDLDIIFVENIGNLVCPAEFNIGEDLRLALLSVPEGDDKVSKYPLMFETSSVIIINKYDCIDYFDFDPERVERDVRDINPEARVLRISSRSGQGIQPLSDYIRDRFNQKKGGRV